MFWRCPLDHLHQLNQVEGSACLKFVSGLFILLFVLRSLGRDGFNFHASLTGKPSLLNEKGCRFWGFGECTFCLCTKEEPQYRKVSCSERTKSQNYPTPHPETKKRIHAVASCLQHSDAVSDPSASLCILSKSLFMDKSSLQQKPVHLCCVSVFLQACLEKSTLA